MAVTRVRTSVRYTHEFVRDSLPEGARRLLEIGCGSGELAALLIDRGLEVVALDADADCVAEARGRGVDARQISWPAQLDERFDAVLFTRSLHHVDDLSGSIAAARRVLGPGGRIIVEDFRAEGAGKRSARWFAGFASALHAGGALSGGIEALLHKAAPSSAHDHHLHSSVAIASELGVAGTDSAYYFRYLEADLRQPEAAQELLAFELDVIAQGSIDALGQRYVAERS